MDTVLVMEKGSRTERVLIVDDQTYFCQLAREMLSKCSRFSVVGESYGGEQAIELVDELMPDLVLMDVEMDGMNGLEATYTIKSRHPDVRVVLMSVYDEREYSELAAQVGALAFIPKKDFSAPTLVRALGEQT